MHLDWQKLKQQYPPPLEDGGELDDDDEDEDDSDSEVPEDSSFSFNNNCDHLGGGGDNDVDDTTNFNASSASLNSPTPPHLTPHSFSADDDDAGILDGNDNEDDTNHELTETERAEQYG